MVAVAAVKGGLCFHRKKRCGFCGHPRPTEARARLRCQCCGRFIRRPGKVVPIVADRCPVCTSRGHVALRLF